MAMRKALLRNVNWMGFGIFMTEAPMVAQAELLGGNVRVGLEDNLLLERAVVTSNGHWLNARYKSSNCSVPACSVPLRRVNNWA